MQGDHSRLLEFSRVGERRREPTDLAELIQGVLEIAQHLQSCRGQADHLPAVQPGSRPGCAGRTSRGSSSTWWSTPWRAWRKGAY